MAQTSLLPQPPVRRIGVYTVLSNSVKKLAAWCGVVGSFSFLSCWRWKLRPPACSATEPHLQSLSLILSSQQRENTSLFCQRLINCRKLRTGSQAHQRRQLCSKLSPIYPCSFLVMFFYPVHCPALTDQEPRGQSIMYTVSIVHSSFTYSRVEKKASSHLHLH